MRLSPLHWCLLALAVAAALAFLGPPERSLGTSVRVVYLHGAWVWAALASFVAAGTVGLAGLVTSRKGLHRWSRALGRTGMVFWITYLPISLWAMQANWNGLFLAEPRWRLAVVFAIGGLLLQTGLSLLDDPIWASGGNVFFLAALLYSLWGTENVMHPGSPIFQSNSIRIQAFYLGLLFLVIFSAWQAARWWYCMETKTLQDCS